LFLSEKHAIALSLLEYSLTGQAGFCVITGEIGSGKTTLLRAFLKRIDRDFTVGLISNTHSSLRDVAFWVLTAFGQKPLGTNPAETYQELMSFLISEYGAGRQCILIVDEAQNLSIEALEELRLLSNINTGKDLLLQMVLVGQPELLQKLRSPELVQFAQRIAVSHHLAPLSYSETRRYILHRLAVAGASKPVFTEMAMGAVQYFSGGVPRLINSICDLALVYGFADGKSPVDEAMVLRVIADRQNSGIAPFARSDSPDDPSTLAEIGDLAEANREEETTERLDADSAADPGDNPAADTHRATTQTASNHATTTHAAPTHATATTQAAATQTGGGRRAATHAAAHGAAGQGATIRAAASQAAATQAAATQSSAAQAAHTPGHQASTVQASTQLAADQLTASRSVPAAAVQLGDPPSRFPEEERSDDFYFADTLEDDISALSLNSMPQADTEPLFEYPQAPGAKASRSKAAVSEQDRPGAAWSRGDAMDAKSWPSITGRSRPAGRTGFANREPEMGEPRRSSWWRRSFLRS
jgi:type II secretory pathway predicted ATPase ExeA